ncbi:murein L,D-transpeptidase catalytic domain family protein [Croceicoccus mobilis]|uniref:Twin-arginine translocation pathway signal protein n=1 Tax=Croceicoccus mobilis TaxID=1703339 RepID=A0A917DTV1_9SPHN|nr:murein L,D-transpeptidase catalytic domain family protein [Croceicoccus mobilis]GGD66165.1 hypothetical protein GCM10010990_14580 [Croceicoccus mobilis]
MNFNRRNLLRSGAAGLSGLAAPRAFAAPAGSRPPAALGAALAALDAHSATPTGRSIKRDFVGLVDFNQHSREKRFDIVDVGNGRVMKSYLVSHGKGSDPAHTGWVQTLSNRVGSNQSSDGAFLTGAAYYGKLGRSRRLHGLDPSNSHAFARAIVMHGADYVSPSLIMRHGKIGRSLGCFAVEQHVRDEVLDIMGEGRLLFAAR